MVTYSWRGVVLAAGIATGIGGGDLEIIRALGDGNFFLELEITGAGLAADLCGLAVNFLFSILPNIVHRLLYTLNLPLLASHKTFRLTPISGN